jgi:hypothetical protein
MAVSRAVPARLLRLPERRGLERAGPPTLEADHHLPAPRPDAPRWPDRRPAPPGAARVLHEGGRVSGAWRPPPPCGRPLGRRRPPQPTTRLGRAELLAAGLRQAAAQVAVPCPLGGPPIRWGEQPHLRPIRARLGELSERQAAGYLGQVHHQGHRGLGCRPRPAHPKGRRPRAAGAARARHAARRS